MSPSEARAVLTPIYDRLQELGFPRHAALKPGVQEFGGLVSKKSYDLDSYISHKTEGGAAVGLSIVQPRGGSPHFLLHRRRIEGRSMPDVSVDQIPLEQVELAAELFLATARLISEVPNSWLPRHPKDE
jgi:hypothetical protein